VIIELLSDSTRAFDKGEKKQLYAHLFRTAEYYLYDPFSHEFLGYGLQGMDYQEIEPDTDGRIYSAVTGLFLGVKDGWLRWFTAHGTVIPTLQELAEQERQRAEQATQRADRAEQLLEAYQRRFGRLEEP
jgi:hypothetical protein